MLMQDSITDGNWFQDPEVGDAEVGKEEKEEKVEGI